MEVEGRPRVRIEVWHTSSILSVMTSVELARETARLAATDTGRGSSRLAEPVLDDLGAAADTLVRGGCGGVVGVVTGFYVPRAERPAAETDGPLGAAILAQVLRGLGSRVEVVTDRLCFPVVRAALIAAGEADIATTWWPAVDTSSWTHAISVERVGRGADGRSRNLLGHDITAVTDPLDSLFDSIAIPTTGIGDGGNEIGMGRLNRRLIDDTVHRGSLIRCVVSTDYLVVGGTSNWGAYALAALITAAAGLPPHVLNEENSRAILGHMLAAGAVDGTTAKNVMSVDGLDWRQYWAIPQAIRTLVWSDRLRR